MKLCRQQAIEFAAIHLYTDINGKDRFHFGPVARNLN